MWFARAASLPQCSGDKSALRRRVLRPSIRRTYSGNGITVGGEVGPPDDFLEVFLPNPNEARGALLWQRTLPDGLNPPQLTLFKQLRDEVERTYPTPPPKNPSKP